MKYKMIVSDVDGTLFATGNRIDPRTRDLIHRFQEVGGVFTLATGRMKKAIDPFIQELELRFPVIVYNGAQIVDPESNGVLFESRLELCVAEQAFGLVGEFPLDMILHVNQQPYVRRWSQPILDHMEKDGIECLVHDDLKSLVAMRPTKMLIIGDPVQLRSYAKALQQSVGAAFQPVCSDWNYLEVLPQGISKGSALRKLAQLTEIPLAEMVTVGDERNDISMLLEAGLGVAVANADEEVKEIADRVTIGSFNRGLEEVILEIIERSDLPHRKK